MRKSALFGLCLCLSLAVFHARTFAGEAKIPSRIGKAKPGEWASYKVVSAVRKFIVSGFEEKDGERHVVIKTQTLLEKRLMNEEESSYRILDANILTKDLEALEAAPREEVIEVKGKEYNVVAVSAKKNGIPFTVYVSEEVPVFGLVRMDMFGKPLLEIHEYGFEDKE